MREEKIQNLAETDKGIILKSRGIVRRTLRR